MQDPELREPQHVAVAELHVQWEAQESALPGEAFPQICMMAGKGRGRPHKARLSLLCLNRAVTANSCPLGGCRAYAGEGSCNSETAGRHLAATAVLGAGTGLFLVLRGTGMAARIREGRAGQMRDGHSCCLPVRRMLWSNSRA